MKLQATYIVNESCIPCRYTDCVEVCPVDCFYEGQNMLVIQMSAGSHCRDSWRFAPSSEFRRIYDLSYETGLKSCTSFRPNLVTRVILSGVEDGAGAPHSCALEREAD